MLAAFLELARLVVPFVLGFFVAGLPLCLFVAFFAGFFVAVRARAPPAVRLARLVVFLPFVLLLSSPDSAAGLSASTNSITAISALSPRRGPSFTMRV